MFKKVYSVILLGILSLIFVGINENVSFALSASEATLPSDRFLPVEGPFEPGTVLIEYRVNELPRLKTNDTPITVLIEDIKETVAIKDYDVIMGLEGLNQMYEGLIFKWTQTVWIELHLDNMLTLDALEKLSQIPSVVHAQPNYIYESTASDDPTLVDPYLESQDYLDELSIPEARDYLTSLSLPKGGSSDIVVAVIDTGVDYNHPDLAPNMWVNTGEFNSNDFSDNDGNGYTDDVYGYNFVDGNPDVMDIHGHGTHVSGILAAKGNNSLGIRGVADNVKIMALKAGDNKGVFTASRIAAAINYASENGADIINMSFGTIGTSDPLVEKALEKAFATSVLIASAGNQGQANSPCVSGADMYPAAYPFVIGVMASNGDQRASFSNYDCQPGDSVEYEVMAPGTQILSTLPDDQYARWSGTSMATPMVSGIAALIMTRFNGPQHNTRFIMGQILNATNTLNDGFKQVDALKALSETPLPEIGFYDYEILDNTTILETNRFNHQLEAGEAAQLMIALRNRWGAAKEAMVTLEALGPDGEESPYVTLTSDRVYYDQIGSFSIKDNGAVYEDQRLVELEMPFELEVDEQTPDNYKVTIKIEAVAKNALDDTDNTLYTDESSFEIVIRNDQEVETTISEDQTWTKDKLYVIEGYTTIEEGVTVTVEPGTQIQFYPSDFDSFEIRRNELNVQGTLLLQGSEEEPIDIFLGEDFKDYLVYMSGNIYMSYVTIENPYLTMKTASHVDFNWVSGQNRGYYYRLSDINYYRNSLSPRVYASRIEKSIFNDFINPGISSYVENSLFDNVVFQSNWDNNLRGENNVFLNNNQVYGYEGWEEGNYINDYRYYEDLRLRPYGNSFENPTINAQNIIRNDQTGTTYFTLESNQLNYMPERFAEYLGGHLATFETEEEREFIRTRLGLNEVQIGLKLNLSTLNYEWVTNQEVVEFSKTSDHIYGLYAIYNKNQDTYQVYQHEGNNHVLFEIPGDIYIQNILLPSSSIRLYENGSSYSLIPELVPFTASLDEINYSSSDASVATISEDGLIRPLSKGTATITVSSKDSVVSKTLEVIVTELVSITDITLSHPTQVVNINRSINLVADVLPVDYSEIIEWTSSDPSIASVNARGAVTGLSEGTVTITAKNEAGDIISNIDVRVFIPVTNITFDNDFLAFGVDALEETLPISIFPENASNKKIVYQSANEDIAYVDEDGFIVPVSTGTVVIRATAEFTQISDEIIVSISTEVDDSTKFVDIQRVGDQNNTRFYALTNTGEIWFWGSGNVYLPKLVTGVNNIQSMSMSESYGLLLGEDGSVYRIYPNGESNIIENLSSNVVNKIVNVSTSNNSTSSRASNNLYLKEDNTVWGIGRNYNTQLMGNTFDVAYSPIQLDGITEIKDILSIYNYSIFLGNNGNVYRNSSEGLLLIDGLSNIDSIKEIGFTNEGYATYFIAKDTSGQFFRVQPQSRSVYPIENEINGLKVIDYSYSYSYAVNRYINFELVLLEDGTVYSKGSNALGQLGIGTTDDNNTFTQIKSLSNISKVFSLATNSAAIDNNGKIFVWGYNNSYQIGDLSTINRLEPYQAMIGIDSDNISPVLESTSPRESETNISLMPNITLDFNEAIKAFSNYSTIVLQDSNGSPKSLSRSIELDKLVISPLNPLKFGETYTLTIPSNALQDYFSNGTSAYSFSFTTEPLITFERETYRIDINDDPLPFNFSLNPKFEGSFTLISSNPSVVTIDDNQAFVPHQLGSSIITLVSSDNQYVYSVEVFVVQRIPVTSLEFENDSMIVSTKDSSRARVNVLPLTYNEDIFFESSDESIARVDEFGFVSGIKDGSVTITVRNKDNTISDTLSVTVVEPVETVQLSQNFYIYSVSESAISLDVDVLPKTATNRNVIWESSDPKIASFNENGELVPHQVGNVTIRVKSEVSSSIYEDAVITITDDLIENYRFKDIAVAGDWNQMTFALSETGDIWYWGEYNKFPQKLQGISNVEKMYSGHMAIAVKDTSGKSYEITPLGHQSPSIKEIAGINNIVSYSRSDDPWNNETTHRLVVNESGELWVAGNNLSNQLIDSSFSNASSWTRIQSVENAVSAIALRNTSIILMEDGDVYYAGNPSTSIGLEKIEGLENIVAIKRYSDSHGGSRDIVAKNENGQYFYVVFNNTGINISSENLPEFDSPVKDYLRNEYFRMVILENGDLYAYGRNNHGNLGLGHSRSMYSYHKVEGISVKAADIIDFFTVVLTSEGYIANWGQGSKYRLGNGNQASIFSPYYPSIGFNKDLSGPQITNQEALEINESDLLDPIIIEFDEAIYEGTNFTAIKLRSSNDVEVSIKREIILNTLVITPLMPLKYGETYNLEVARNSLQDYRHNLISEDRIEISTEPLVEFERLNYRLDINDPDLQINYKMSSTYTGSLQFESTTPSVISVDNKGLMSIQGAGNATIKVTSSNNEYTFMIDVEVLNIIPLETISFVEEDITIKIGETERLSIVSTPNNANEFIRYVSSDVSVATIDEFGFIRGLSQGTVTITAIGSRNEIEDQITVEVYKSISDINFEETTYVFEKGATNLSIPADTLPNDATEQALEYLSSNENIITINEDNTINAVEIGTVKIRVRGTRDNVSKDIIVSVVESLDNLTYPVDIAVTGYGDAVFAVLNDNSVWFWGNSQYTSGLASPMLTPTKTNASLEGEFKTINSAMFYFDRLSILIDNELYSLGQYSGNSDSTSSHFKKITSLQDLVDVSLGRSHSIALDSSGNVWSWGDNNSGQLGDGTRSNRSSPIQVPLFEDNPIPILQVATGHSTSYALDEDMVLHYFGDNINGIQTYDLSDYKVKSIYNGHYNDLYFVTDDQKIYSFGSGNTPMLRVDTVPSNREIIDLSNGSSHTMILLDNGEVYTFGQNSYGQLGNDSTSSSENTLVKVPLENVIKIEAGYYQSYAITEDNQLYGWGRNNSYQMADFTSDNALSPQPIVFGAVPDDEKPVILEQSINNGDTNVSITDNYTFVYNEALVRGNEFVTITLKDASNRLVSINRELNWDTLIITPSEPLNPNESYTLTLSGNALMDFFNNPSNSQTITFTTEASGAIQNIEEPEEDEEDTSRFYYTLQNLQEAFDNYVQEGYFAVIHESAILNNLVNQNEDQWLKIVTTESNPSRTFYYSRNYWGTSDNFLIQQQIIDNSDNSEFSTIETDPVLTSSTESMYPHITQILVTNSDGDVLSNVSNETVQITVSFNRDMDTTQSLSVGLGSSYPYNDYQVFGTWEDAKTWSGVFRVGTSLSNGRYYFRVSDAVAADDTWLDMGVDEGRFMFQVNTFQAESMNLQASGLEGRIKLTWNQDDFDTLAGYNVYRSSMEESGFEVINNRIIPATSATYEDTTVQPGQTYYYKFTVVQTDFSESEFSNTAFAASFDTIPPSLSHIPINRTNVNQSVILRATATDNIGIQSLTLFYRHVGETTYQSIEMNEGSTANRYAGEIRGSDVKIPGIEYYIEADDGNSITRFGSSTSPQTIRVIDAPTLRSVSPGRAYYESGDTITLTGNNFKADSRVFFGNLEGLNTVISSDGETITTTLPDNAPRKVNVSVVNPGGESSILYNAFEYYSDDTTVKMNNVLAAEGQEIIIPVIVDNATALLALDMTLSYEASHMDFVSVAKGNITRNFTMDSNEITDGQIKISMASNQSVTGNGDLFYITFKLNSNLSTDEISVAIESVSLNSDSIGVEVINATVNIQEVYQVRGTIRYYSNQTPINNVSVHLFGDGELTSIASSGEYLLQSIVPGNYQMDVVKTDETSSITAFDASKILRYSVGNESLNSNQLIAADVNNDGVVNSLDASDILQYITDMISLPFSGAESIWKFIPNTTPISSINSNYNNHHLTGILIGDVSGNYQSLSEALNQNHKGVVHLSPIAAYGDNYQLELSLKYVDYDVYSFETTLKLSEGLKVESIHFSESIDACFNIQNTINPGEVKIAIACGETLPQDESLIYIEFSIEEEIEIGSVDTQDSLINEHSMVIETPRYRQFVQDYSFITSETLSRSDVEKFLNTVNQAITEESIKYDVNHDGIIDIFDIIAMRRDTNAE